MTGAEPGVATARVDSPDTIDPPDPLEHAAPDVELAEEQLALGRELANEPEPERENEVSDQDEAVDDAEAADEVQPEFGSGPDIPGVLPEPVRVEAEDDGDALPAAPAPAHVAEPRRRHGNRLLNFLQGSWRELQRVQWPDRRQVMQATGVVIGFVVVAGVFLGVADFLATKIMNYILTGHFK